MLLSFASLSVRAAEFYAAPNGQPTGTGSITSPWDLQTALNHPAAVKPGDTIWLRGGVHRLSNRVTKFVSRLTGVSGQPITVRQYPGERATIDGNIQQVTGGWVNYWGFEIYNSNPNRYTDETGPFPQAWWVNYDGKLVDLCVSGFDLQAPNIKMINLVVHDSIGGGFGINKTSQDAEMYGCLSYYNGWQASDRAHGHGIYEQNAAPYTKTIKDNLVFENLGLGMQNTGAGPDACADNLRLDGNAFFMNGILAKNHQANLLVGAFQGQGRNSVITANCVYDTMGTMSDSNIGYDGGLVSPVVRDNYFSTSVLFSSLNSSPTITGNTFAGGTPGLTQSSYPNNTYLTSKPTSNKIVVRPNQYEAGRANIVVYNWQKLNSVTVDVSGIGLVAGQQYELHNAADFFNDVIVGTYNGGSITVPMTGHTVAKPVGQNFSLPPSTFPEFGAFVIMRKSGSTPVPPPATNSAPVISTISDQTTKANTPTSVISFTVSDAETAAANLVVTGSSSNTTLVPDANIAFGGSGTNRTVTITPAANQSGTTTITIKVSDGVNTTSRSFLLTVSAVTNTPPTISSIASQTTKQDTATAPIVFTVNDAETPADKLTVLAASANQTLVPNANIALGGSGSSRTLTITPASGQSGTAMITVSVNDTVASSSTSFNLTVTTNSTPQPPPPTTTNQVYLGLEAEAGTNVAPMTIVTNAQLPAQRYILSKVANQGTATYGVDLPQAGAYYLWAKVLCPSYTNDSFFVSVDGKEDIFDAAEGKQSSTWQWSRVNGRNGGAPLTLNPRVFNLTQGKHSIVIRGREATAGLDRMILTTDSNYVPMEVVAKPDNLTVYADSTTQILASDLLRNDTSLFNTALVITGVSNAVNGSVTLTNGTITYRPKAGFVGADSFVYAASDGQSLGTAAKVTVDVKAPDKVYLGLEAETGTMVSPMTIATDAQVATRRYIWTTLANQGTASYTIDIPKTDTYVMWCKVLCPSYASDSYFISVDGKEDVFDAAEGKQSSTWQWSQVNGRNGGAPLTLNPRTFSLTQGKHTIVIRGREVKAGLDRIVISNDRTYAPKDLLAVADTVPAKPNTVTVIGAATLTQNDVALFGDALTITAVGVAQNGTAALSNGSITYTPKAGFVGTDTFTYTVSDGQGNTSTATVTVTVQSTTTAG